MCAVWASSWVERVPEPRRPATGVEPFLPVTRAALLFLYLFLALSLGCSSRCALLPTTFSHLQRICFGHCKKLQMVDRHLSAYYPRALSYTPPVPFLWHGFQQLACCCDNVSSLNILIGAVTCCHERPSKRGTSPNRTRWQHNTPSVHQTAKCCSSEVAAEVRPASWGMARCGVSSEITSSRLRSIE